MTVELARRLIESGVPLADIEAALLLVVERGLSLTEALAERDSGLLSRVEQELSRSELPSVLTVRASPELYGRLPAGMCRRLLAVPVHVDPRTGRVDVAAAEPLDPHIAQEFAFHLDQPVRVLHASHEAVMGALERLQRGTKVSVLPPGRLVDEPLGSDAPIPLVKLDSGVRSDAPIPLVRRSMLPARPSALPAPRSVPPTSVVPEAEGVALSWRSKPPPVDLVAGAAQLDARAVGDLPRRRPPRRRASCSKKPPSPKPCSSCFVIAWRRRRQSCSRSRMRASTVAWLPPTSSSASSAKHISLLSHQPSVLETAVKSGFYLGPIPNTPNHRELRDALPPDAVNEVYVTVVTVSDRPSLVWLIAGFEQSLDLTRRADELALAAGRALARILRDRKRQLAP